MPFSDALPDSEFFLFMDRMLSRVGALALSTLMLGCSTEDSVETNLALEKAAYASSSYDYNLTAQLVTDGIVETAEPAWLSVSTSKGELPRREKEWTIDGGPYSCNTLFGESDFLDYKWTCQAFSAKRLRVKGKVLFNGDAGGWRVSCLAGKGGDIKEVGFVAGPGLPSKVSGFSEVISDPNKQTETIDCQSCPLDLEIPLSGAVDLNHLRLEFSMSGAVAWQVFSVSLTESETFGPTYDSGPYFSKEARGMNLMPSRVFTSAWMSAGGDPQWIYVDLGGKTRFSAVRLHWIHKAKAGAIEVSDDAVTWKEIAGLPDTDSLSYVVKVKGNSRYVRLSMEGADESGHFTLSEMEVLGKGRSEIPDVPWRLRRASLVNATGEELSSAAFLDDDWMPAVVPGTVLYSYVAAGAVPDPGIGDNMSQISESYFNGDFWYRGKLSAEALDGRRALLSFDGINWKAEVFMNGKRLGDIAGAFKRKSFDVTDILEEDNTVAVHVIQPAHFGAVKEKNAESPDFNGGVLGADNPTFHATVGWDWIPTVRGRDTGIWNDVRIDYVNDVVLRDPLVVSKLAYPDTLASMTFSVEVENLSEGTVSGQLVGSLGENLTFGKDVSISGGATTTVTFTPEDFPQLKDRSIALWWPVGYGNPVSHKAFFVFKPDGKGTESRVDFLAGIREFTYEGEDSALNVYVNGHRMTPKGGNWGFSEYNLRFGAKEYDTALRLHKDMGLNMVRNWVGQTGDDEFYEACDKYGITVWQDFWLANPADGPDPDDNEMFLDNARDMIKRVRRHPSVCLYCGRNEGYPPKALDEGLEAAVKELHPSILYIPNSAEDGVSGHGPYRAVKAEYYFDNPTKKFHSERGMPAIPVYGNLERMLTKSHLWEPDDVWGQHDFTRTGAQGDTSLLGMIRRGFGDEALSDARSFAKYAQFFCFDGYRAMFEANNVNRHGLLLWMSHSAWPSLAWQTYDYWFTENGAYYGTKLGAEPLHVQFNPASLRVEVVNAGVGDESGLIVSVRLLGKDGAEIYSKTAEVSVKEDETLPAIDLSDIPDGLCVMILSFKDKSGKEISHNEYVKNFVNGRDNGDYRELIGTDVFDGVLKLIGQ